jgi:hypothetical protein
MSDRVEEFDTTDDVVAEFNRIHGPILAPDRMANLVAFIAATAGEFHDQVDAVADVLLRWSPEEVAGYSAEVEAGIEVDEEAFA